MKKLITLLGMIWLLWSAAYAQDCTLKVQFNIIPASCYNNGKVAYALLDADNNIVASASELGLHDVRIYYKVNEGDSAHYGHFYTGGWDTLTIDFGTYIIGVEGLCSDGGNGWIKADTHLVMNIPTTYVTPTVESFYNLASDTTAYGKRPSSDCINTGRVQLILKDGKLPYYVTIKDFTTGETLRIDTVTQPQYSGNNPNLYNYKDYYSFDSLPPGTWVFSVVDGCHYGLPNHTQEVEVSSIPWLVTIQSSSQSGEYVDELSTRYVNVAVNINNPALHFANGSINKRYWHNLVNMPQMAEYRIVYGGNLGASEWRPVPSTGLTGYGVNYCRVTLRDTVSATLCEDILGNTFTLEWKDKCHDTIISKTFTFGKPLSYSASSFNETDSVVEQGCSVHGYSHTSYYSINIRNAGNYGQWNGSFTKPLYWAYIDVNTGDTIHRDTINTLAQVSLLTDSIVESIYGSFRTSPRTIRTKRVLISDECGVLFERTDNLIFKTTHTSGQDEWQASYNFPNYSCSVPRKINVLYPAEEPDNLDGTIVRLTTSPNDNFYNFEATYDTSSKSWTITRSNPDNNIPIIGNASGNNIYLEDPSLPGGTYIFQITSSCGSYTKQLNITPSYIPNWTLTTANAVCITNSRSITLKGTDYKGAPSADLDGTIIRLVSSPYSNRYNFEAVYSTTSKKWTFTTPPLAVASLTNSNPTANDPINAIYSAVGLPNGTYEFVIITPCTTYTKTLEAAFSEMISYDLVETPEYTIDDECVLSYVTYTKGQFEKHFYQTASVPDQDFVLVPELTEDAPTYFQIISGPLGGYDGAVHVLGEPIRISMPGTFVVNVRSTQTYYANPANYCYVNYFDTIRYDRNTVEFDYAVALLCEPGSTHGNVFVGGANGIGPYTYTLYRNADKQGPVLGTNNTGIFENIEMSPTEDMSCLVQDQCGAYFHINLRPKTWSELQRVWFDDGMTVSSSCEGGTICVNAISIGSILHYNWVGPNGFSSTEAHSCVTIPRGGEEGWYKVHIVNSGCGDDFYDSIYLNIDRSPWVELASDTTLCPGTPIEVKMVPKSPNTTTDNVTFTMVIENIHETITHNFSLAPGDTARYTITPLTNTKVYVLNINDGTCNFAEAEDTMHVNVYNLHPYTVTTNHDTICYGTTGTISAQSSLIPPYALRWYNDYNHTDLVKEDSLFTADAISSMTLTNLTNDTIFYIVVENDEYCPTTYGKPTHKLNMANGETELSLGHTYRFYDSGGPSANYGTNEHLTHTFSSTDGKPVTMKFESFTFNNNARLTIFTGQEVNPDSTLCTLTQGSPNPGTIVSHGDALTCYFVSSTSRAAGWSAIVEHEPAKAIIKVRPKDEITYYDTVCQSQTHSYADPHHIAPAVTSLESLNNAVRKHGTHTFSNVLTNANQYGCDSTVTFIMSVTIPPRHDTSVVITNLQNGYSWHDSLYTQSGSHTHYIALEDGCDSLDILYIVVLDVDTSDNEICPGDSTDLTISVTRRETQVINDVIPRTPRVGDVLCTDGYILHPDSFLLSDKTAMGVVVSVDLASGYGRAIALTNAHTTTLRWAYNKQAATHSVAPATTFDQAIADMNGAGNTDEMIRTAKVAGGASTNTATNAPAAHYCKFFNHNTYKVGTDSLGWYFPSAGEMQIVYSNRTALNNTLNKLKELDSRNTLLSSSGNYWTSTEYNNNASWYFHSSGYLQYNGTKTSVGNVRAMIKFPLP